MWHEASNHGTPRPSVSSFVEGGPNRKPTGHEGPKPRLDPLVRSNKNKKRPTSIDKFSQRTKKK